MIKFRQLVYILTSIVSIVIVTCLVNGSFPKQKSNAHNCRFWGIIFSELPSTLADTIKTHLDSLRALGINNPDGWGIGYFQSPDTQGLLAVITRGGPAAQVDPRYTTAVENMIKYTEHCGIAHVRSGTSGPCSGIPNPHPFLRNSLHRNLQIFLAHNGTLPIKQLLNLITTINPNYLELNPPDYEPIYLDSDLYAIYIMEIIDTYLDSTIEECLRIAITKLDSAIGLSEAKFNFVMSDGTTMWALHYNRSVADEGLLYLYPNVSESDFWIVASTPLDTFSTFWAAVPNSTLVAFKPNEPPQFIEIFSVDPFSLPKQPLFEIIYPNPFKGKIDIRFCMGQSVLSQGTENSRFPNGTEGIGLKIYDINGRLVKEFPLPTVYSGLPIIITWDGTDNKYRELPHGIYYCTLNIDGQTYTRKLVLLK